MISGLIKRVFGRMQSRGLRAGDWILRPDHLLLQARADDGAYRYDIWYPYLDRDAAMRVIDAAGPIVENMGELWHLSHATPLYPLRFGALAMPRAVLRNHLLRRENAALYHPRAPKGNAAYDLPLIAALGAVTPSWRRFWLNRWGRGILFAIARIPNGNRWFGQGIILPRCTARLRFHYALTPREFDLHQVRLHANGNYLLIGQVQPENLPRTFKLDRLSAPEIIGYGPFDTCRLHAELHRLTDMSAPPSGGTALDHMIGRINPKIAIHWEESWERRRQASGLRLQDRPSLARRIAAKARRLWYRLRWNNAALSDWLAWQRARWRGLPKPKAVLRAPLAKWRRRLHRYADLLEQGAVLAPAPVANCDVLARDIPLARALLRGILVELRRANPNADLEYWVPRLLDLSPPGRKILRRQDVSAAQDAFDRLEFYDEFSLSRKWSRLKRGGSDPNTLIVANYIRAIYPIGTHRGSGQPTQELERAAFRAVLMIYCANWSAGTGDYNASCAARLRWLADFDPPK